MSFTAFSLLNCSVLHLLLWLIRVCLSALSPQVFYQLECLVICRLFFNPRFVKSDPSLSQIFLPFLLRLMLMRRSTWVLLPVLNYLEPFPIFLIWTLPNAYIFYYFTFTFSCGRVSLNYTCIYSENLCDISTCIVKLFPVTWWLQVNEDLEGEVRFASAVGPFTVPLRCTIKKCDVSICTVTTRWRQ